jgi:hypothetical protein
MAKNIMTTFDIKIACPLYRKSPREQCSYETTSVLRINAGNAIPPFGSFLTCREKLAVGGVCMICIHIYKGIQLINSHRKPTWAT